MLPLRDDDGCVPSWPPEDEEEDPGADQDAPMLIDIPRSVAYKLTAHNELYRCTCRLVAKLGLAQAQRHLSRSPFFSL